MKVDSLFKHSKVIDLFCGIGGMTHGFVLEHFNVVAGVDIDPSCQYGYEINNKAKFILEDIKHVSSKQILELFGNAKVKILIGCAPCQPFSTLNIKRDVYAKHSEKWSALNEFARLINDVKPEIVSMENVKDLANQNKYPIFKSFINVLKKNRYNISYQVVDTSEYGIPQKRKRLVLLASRLGKINLSDKDYKKNFVSVKDAIEDLPPLKDGETNSKDKLHTASKLNLINKKRIMSTPHNGGSATDWDEKLLPKCFRKKSGNTYKCTVYGRMSWNKPAPTMTTHCNSLGTGRYGHPEQNRAITLREAARFQTFPDQYVFSKENNFSKTTVARHIGNAVPVKLGQVIAESIKTHIKNLEN